MSTITLKQLKAENTDENEETETPTQEAPATELEAVAEVTEAVTEGNDDQAGELEKSEPESETDGEPVEAWMQTEGQTSDDKQHKGPSFRGLKQKLRAKIEVKDDEIARLQEENAALKAGTVQTPVPQESQAQLRPKREDFDHGDDDGFDNAVDKWHDDRLDARLNRHTQTQEKDRAVNSQQQAITNAVDQHYENASKLVADGKVTEEEYLNADKIVRGTINQVTRGQGDIISDFLISRLNGAGEGSEKVWYHLGRNQTALATLKNKLADDPNGLDAVMYLGELRATLTASPAKRVSQAPQPGSRIKGDASTSGDSALLLLKKYKKAEGNVQARIDLKREAKDNGVDTTAW